MMPLSMTATTTGCGPGTMAAVWIAAGAAGPLAKEPKCQGISVALTLDARKPTAKTTANRRAAPFFSSFSGFNLTNISKAQLK
jgi:hypothetical protein